MAARASRVGAAGRGRLSAFSTLTVDKLPKQVVECEYAVRGAVLLRAEELQKELANPATADKVPFKKIVPCNIGNPQAVGQQPLQFHRQVLSCLTEPSLIERGVFPARAGEGLHVP